MAKQIESGASHDLTEALFLLGVYAYKLHGAGMGKSGLPDIITCVGGRFVGIEVKVNHSKLTEIQELNLLRLIRNGGVGTVARYYPTVKTWTLHRCAMGVGDLNTNHVLVDGLTAVNLAKWIQGHTF